MSTPPESPCLPDELLAALMDGNLGAQELPPVHRHLAQCPACRALLASAVRADAPLEQGPAPTLDSALTWAPPSQFDEFQLGRPLGHGAMGVVYLAQDRSLDRQVAVKFIASHRPGPKARERFQTEARAIARLQHPNVVTVFRVGEVEGHPYIVSEYLAGQSLSELSLPLPWRRALELGLGLAQGLAGAHRQGVLHRDLKPANVLLTLEGEVKLLDFGLAELVGTGLSPQSRGASSAAGTPRYMAPELFRGTPATPQSDLYSLGLLLHELCTGARPGNAGDGPRLATAPGMDLDFALIIERCLRPEPAERFASAEALCAALARLHTPGELPAGNPYRGLAPFEPEHRALFFGRDADIRAVLERLRRQPLVLIAGDSGAGKSSLCRAGILSRVTQGALDEYRDFSTVVLTPGRRPLAALAAALAPLLGQPEAQLCSQFAESPQGLGQALRAAYPEGRGLLLFIDQLEELLTLAEPNQATCFAGLLAELALPTAGVRVLLAVRGDFLTRLSALPGLGMEIERALYLLRPLTPEGVREAITGPARGQGVVFESEALLQELTGAMAQGAGSLPLLQFTLAELWERRDQTRACISQAALDELGGVAGTLSRHADTVLARLDRAGQQTARQLFGRLTTAEGTRIERSEEELSTTSEQAPEVLRALVLGRLLLARTTEGRTSYAIAHEALLTGWSTLRRWLDEDAGQRALQQRVELAGAQWQRSGRSAELLWRGRPLEETRGLDTASLGAREQDFLRASHRAVRRQRQRRGLAALLVTLAVGAAYLGPRLHAHLETQRFVEARMSEARTRLDEGRALGQRASELRQQALSLFDEQHLWSRAMAAWARTLDTIHEADAAHTEAERAVEDALERDSSHPEARHLLAQLLYERILLTERFYLAEERERLLQRFKRLTAGSPEWQERLDQPAELELATAPPGASVELSRYVDDKGVLRLEQVAVQPGTTPTATLSLPPGSYQVRLTRQGLMPVELPLWLERGEREHVHLVLPAAVPQGTLYIPPGCFLSGSSAEELRGFLKSAPLHRTCLPQGYLITRTEVTLGEWLEYLDTLPPGAAERRLLEKRPAEIGGTSLELSQQPGGPWRFTLRLPGVEPLMAMAGEHIHYPGRSHRAEQDWRRFPLVGVSSEDMAGYLSWLRSTGRLPGARLCNELEWERAASGADGRKYPHGQRLEPDDANIDATYDIEGGAHGPDEVGAHPASTSPFGLVDMAGNAIEMTRPLEAHSRDLLLRGGAWYYGEAGSLIANRQRSVPTIRDPRVGLRLCASLPEE